MAFRRIEIFIKAQNGNKIKSLSAADITRYFEAPGRQNRLEGWQFAQHINAIQILYCESPVPFGYLHYLCERYCMLQRCLGIHQE